MQPSVAAPHPPGLSGWLGATTCHASYPLNSDNAMPLGCRSRNALGRQLDGCGGDSAAGRGNDEGPNNPLRHIDPAWDDRETSRSRVPRCRSITTVMSTENAGRIYWTKVSMKAGLLCPT